MPPPQVFKIYGSECILCVLKDPYGIQKESAVRLASLRVSVPGEQHSIFNSIAPDWWALAIVP